MLKDTISKSLRAASSLVTGKVRMQFDRIPFEFENVPLKKLLNWACVEASVRIKPAKPWGLPTHLQIEPSSLCNLRCPACRVVTGLERPGGFMEPDLFKKIIDEACESVFLISLWGWGEPFLNPAVYDMIAHAKSKGVRLVSSTNGHFLGEPDQVDRLIRSGLDVLIVAVDGATQETYGLYRRPGRLNSVLEGIRRLSERKRVLKSKWPLVNVRFVVMRQNEHEISKMLGLAESCGADMLSLKTMNPLTDDPYSLDRDPQDDSNDRFIPRDPRYQRFQYGEGSKTRIRVKKNPCRRLWNNPKIHSDGSVCTCTCDVAGKFSMGDLKTQTLRKIWTSEIYRLKRAQFRAHWERMQPCCTCTYAYEGGSCVDEIISDMFFFDPRRSSGY